MRIGSSPTRGSPTRGSPTRGSPTRGSPTRGRRSEGSSMFDSIRDHSFREPKEYLNQDTYNNTPVLPEGMDTKGALTDICPITQSLIGDLNEPVLLKVGNAYKLYEWGSLCQALITDSMREPTTRQLINPNQLVAPQSDDERILWRVEHHKTK